MKIRLSFALLVLILVSSTTIGRRLRSNSYAESNDRLGKRFRGSRNMRMSGDVVKRIEGGALKFGLCVPGTEWNDGCNDCLCREDNAVMCTRRTCLRSPTSSEKCIPGDVWKKSCNICWCMADKIVMCTQLQCGANSDFMSSECRENSIPCYNGLCVPASWRCDGVTDCLTGLDEANCDTDDPGKEQEAMKLGLQQVRNKMETFSPIINRIDKNIKEMKRSMNESLVDTHRDFKVIRNNLRHMTPNIQKIEVILIVLRERVQKKLEELMFTLNVIKLTQQKQTSKICDGIISGEQKSTDRTISGQLKNISSELEKAQKKMQMFSMVMNDIEAVLMLLEDGIAKKMEKVESSVEEIQDTQRLHQTLHNKDMNVNFQNNKMDMKNSLIDMHADSPGRQRNLRERSPDTLDNEHFLSMLQSGIELKLEQLVSSAIKKTQAEQQKIKRNDNKEHLEEIKQLMNETHSDVQVIRNNLRQLSPKIHSSVSINGSIQEIKTRLNTSFKEIHNDLGVIRSNLRQLSLKSQSHNFNVTDIADELKRNLDKLNSSLVRITEIPEQQQTSVNKDFRSTLDVKIKGPVYSRLDTLKRMDREIKINDQGTHPNLKPIVANLDHLKPRATISPQEEMKNAITRLSTKIAVTLDKIEEMTTRASAEDELPEQTSTVSQNVSSGHITMEKHRGNAQEIIKNSRLKLRDIRKMLKQQVIPPNIRVSQASFPCPIGFIKWKDSCYYISQETAYFPSASFQCRDWGSYLVTIDSEEENSALRNLTTEENNGSIFITGGNDILMKQAYVWEMTQKSLNYSKIGVPKINSVQGDLSDSSCVVVFVNGTSFSWSSSLNCFHGLGNSGSRFICEKNLTREEMQNSEQRKQVKETLADFYVRLQNFENTLHLMVPEIPVNVSSSCPIGFQRIDSNCYIASREKMDWYTASYICKDYGGWLITIDTNKKREAIQKAIAGSTPGREGSVWIGGHGLYQQDNYIWAETGVPVQMSQKNITDANRKNCLVFHNGTIKGFPCHKWTAGFVCERTAAE